MPTPEQHALLSASSSDRWLHCTPSARLAEEFPESSSSYAEAGRVAHAIAELKARKYFIETMPTRSFNSQLKKLKEDPNYDKGMDASTDAYLEYLQSLAFSFGSAAHPFVTLENRVDYSDYAPEGFGTADCIMIAGDTLCVCDYKNGAGVPVEAENNSQMMLYALGALKLYGMIYGDTLQKIHLAIIQPNAGGVKEWSLPRRDLEIWGTDFVYPRAQLAWDGKGEFVPGDWCRFCPAKAQCTARSKQMLALKEYDFAKPAGDPKNRELSEPLLSDADVGAILEEARHLAAWVKDLEDYALGACLAGREITGFKIVEGRGSREWDDTDAAFKDFVQIHGLPEAMLYERKPVSVAGLEKALGKKEFAAMAASHVLKKPGKPTLVPESDKRPPYNAAEIAFGGAADG